MKRCSQCDFIYENDQSFCDLDGGELICNPTLSLPAKSVGQTAGLLKKPRWRNFTVLSFAAVILGVILFSVSYIFAHRGIPQNTSHSLVKDIDESQSTLQSASPAAPQSSPNTVLEVPAATANPPRSLHPPIVTNVRATDRTTAPMVKSSQSHSRSPLTPQEEKKPKLESANHEKEPRQEEKKLKTDENANHQNQNKESTLGSILKKTGHLLKRPFKF